MNSLRRRDLIAGAMAGLLSGLFFGLAMKALRMMEHVSGILGISFQGNGFFYHLLLSILIGALFGAIFRYHAKRFAANFSGGLLFGMLWWILGPLTIGQYLVGSSPMWSLSEAGSSFPNLIGHIFFGGVLGLGFYIIVALYLRAQPESEIREQKDDIDLKHIVILGGGFGGVACAQRLSEIMMRERQKSEITLVSESNYLLFTPMLAEVASSALEARHISSPLRAACPSVQFIHSTVEAINTKSQFVNLRAATSNIVERLSYDHLILSLGSVPNYFDLPGLKENSFSLKTLHDATLLRNHVISMLERADVEMDQQERNRLLTLVVAGGGFAGVEVIAELFDLVHSVLHMYPTIASNELRFILVHSRERILPELSPKLADYSLRLLQARGIEFMLGDRVSKATSEEVTLRESKPISTRTLVWTAGNQPNPILKTLPAELSGRGSVLTEASMLVKGFGNLWAVGDCAQIPNLRENQKPYPPTAQHASRQGKAVAENIVASIEGRSPKSFHYRSIGSFVSLGHRAAAAEIRGLQFSGVIAWLMWRAIYFSKLPGLEKKLRVAIDWILDIFFPRDIVLTAEMPTPTLSEMLSGDERIPG